MKRTLSLLLVLTVGFLQAQEVGTTSANPPNIKWLKIENQNSNIIFPKGLEAYAKRIAETVDYIDKSKKQSIGKRSGKLPIVLHGQSMEPNGFVSAVPFRSEFYPTPIANWNGLGQNEWLETLALHEYRHALQMSNANVGLTKFFRILTGRYGQQGSMLFGFPAWFAEGDAVLTETLQSEGGRGRLPSFSAEQRANFYAGKHYSYMKARNDSYKTQLPSHYPFGYIQNLYAREKFGNEVWAKVLNDANWYKSIIYPFSGAVKRNTGLPARKLYMAAYDDFEKRIENQLDKTSLIKFDTLTTPHQKQVISYIYPKLLENGDVIARKSSYKETAHLVKIEPNGNETKLTNIGATNNAFLSYNENGVMWLEKKPNPRWTNVATSRVVYFDWQSQQKKYLLENKRVFFAAISPSSEQFLTVEYGTDLNYTLHLYNTESGEKIGQLENDQNWGIANPLFDKNGQYIYYTAKYRAKIALVKHDLRSNEKTFLTNWENHVMVEPSQTDTHIYFRADFSGIDNIYAVAKNGDKRITKISSVPVGGGYPTVLKEKLVFSNYAATGNHLASMASEIRIENAIQTVDPLEMEAYSAVNNLSENGSILNSIPEQNYEVKNYNSFLRGWKLHSWGVIPSAGSSEEEGDLPTLASSKFFVAMDDILGANSLVASYTRYINDAENGYGVDYEMGRFYTKLNIGYEFRARKVEAKRGNRILNYKEQEAKVGLSVPLEMVKGNFNYKTNMAVNWKGIQQFRNSDLEGFDNSKFGLYEVLGGFDIKRRTAYQNIQSRLGGGASFKYGRSFQEGYAGLFKLSAQIYLPGIGKNHGIEIQQAYQNENVENTYQYVDLFSYGRGLPKYFNETVSRTSVNYHLPLFYPDFGIPGVTFLKRVRANAFFDNVKVDDTERKAVLRSAGFEFRFDQKLFNLIELPIGFRVGYRFPNELLDLEPIFFEFVIGD